MRLDGKVAWVTGSSRGLGRVIAEQLAAAGAKVAVNAFAGRERGEAIVAGVRERGGEALLVVGDAMDAADIDRMAGEIEAGLGPIDIVVVNATPHQPMEAIEDYRWEDHVPMLEAFVKSPFLLAQRLLPGMKERRAGRIVNVTSEVFHNGMPGFSAYVAAKGAQVGWTRTMANELAPWNITVNAVAPGWVPVERHEDAPAEAKQAYLETIPLGRWGKPEDVAGAVRYFASDAASFVTGQTLVVDGGKVLW